MRFSKSFFAGLLFLSFGVFTVIGAMAYPYGTPLSIGPGALPTIAGLLLIFMGGAMMIQAAFSGEATIDFSTWHLRPLLIVNLAVVTFGLLIELGGLVLSSAVLIVVCSLASNRSRVLQILAMAIGYPVIITLLFVYGLGIPFGVWPFS